MIQSKPNEKDNFVQIQEHKMERKEKRNSRKSSKELGPYKGVTQVRISKNNGTAGLSTIKS